MIFIFLILFLVSSGSYAQQTPEVFTTQKIAQFEKNAYMLSQSKEKMSKSSDNFDVKYYRCEWETDPAVRLIKGKVTSYFVFVSSSSSITYDLMNSMQIDSITGRNNSLDFVHENNTVTIRFSDTKAAGTLDSVSIYYHGPPANGGFGSFEISNHQGVPVVWTLSEPYGSRDWWPCKNGLGDKADSLDVYITAPAQYTAVSNGLMQSETIAGNLKTTYWKHRYPIASYLVCMAVTNFAEYKNYVTIGDHNLLMQTFCYPESLTLFQSKTPLVLTSLQFFSKIFGDYPFIKEKYGHVQFGWGGGMEHQTSTFLITPDENLMSHELGHQWFGDKITVASWQHIWLSEGFATHLADMDWENKYPQTVINRRKNDINSITSSPGGSVFVEDTSSVNRIFDSRLSYTKGSHLLYMLRWILTDSVFFKGVNSYFNDPSIAYGSAITKDLQRNLENVSGKKLDYFFDQWFYGAGYPSYKVEWTPIGNDKARIRIKINQTTSDPSVSFFALPVPLLFKNATQEKLVVVDNTINGEIFLKEIGFVADTVIVDPNYWLITRNNVSEKMTDNSKKNTLKIYPNPVESTLNIDFRNFTSDKASLRIYDFSGKLLIKEEITINGYNLKSINLSSLPKGAYFVKIESGDGIKFAQKIIRI